MLNQVHSSPLKSPGGAAQAWRYHGENRNACKGLSKNPPDGRTGCGLKIKNVKLTIQIEFCNEMCTIGLTRVLMINLQDLWGAF